MAKTVVKAPNKHTARLRCQQSIAGSFMLPCISRLRSETLDTTQSIWYTNLVYIDVGQWICQSEAPNDGHSAG